MKNSKWNKTDKFLLSLQIISTIVSVIVSFIPEAKLNNTVKLTIISACIGIPIIIVQVSMTNGQNNINENINDFRANINTYINESHQILKLYQIYSSKKERIKRFADRRISSLISSLTRANQIGDSNYLEVREYYEELYFLAEKLKNDNSKKCEIWAMTGFAPDEWSATGGYEKSWTDELKKLSKIKTQRLCLLDNDLLEQIKNKEFVPQQKTDRGTSLDGLISLLKQYYCSNKPTCEHYILLKTEFDNLVNAKGFFGIVLSNGEKHVVQGEAVNLDNGLTGSVLFNTETIETLYNDFNRACQPDREIIKFINNVTSENFKKHLKTEGIKGIN